MTKRAADRSTIARLPMTDVLDRFGNDRKLRLDLFRELDVPLPRHCPDFQVRGCEANRRQAVHAIEINDVVRCRETHVHHRHQRLAAREQSAILERTQQGNDFVD